MTKFSSRRGQLNSQRPTKPATNPNPTIVEREDVIKEIHTDDDSYNSGFGSYLRSGEGIEMMKLFVMANSVLVVLTMAWPNMQEVFQWLKEAYNYYL